MTLEELYQAVDGSYAQAKRVLRVDRLIDKHIRKFVPGGVIDRLVAAGDTMDATQLFEAAHAAKGVCGNLGLVSLQDASSAIAEEFRPGNARTMTDDEVRERIAQIAALYEKTKTGIATYEQS